MWIIDWSYNTICSISRYYLYPFTDIFTTDIVKSIVLVSSCFQSHYSSYQEKFYEQSLFIPLSKMKTHWDVKLWKYWQTLNHRHWRLLPWMLNKLLLTENVDMVSYIQIHTELKTLWRVYLPRPYGIVLLYRRRTVDMSCVPWVLPFRSDVHLQVFWLNTDNSDVFIMRNAPLHWKGECVWIFWALPSQTKSNTSIIYIYII